MYAFLTDPEVVVALQAGTIAALLCAFVGTFVVLRRQSFAGHAITDIGFTGGAGAGLAHANPLAGLLAFAVGGALAIGKLDGRVRERDVSTGVILTVALALASLFLFIATRFNTQPEALLFGSIFAIDPNILTPTSTIGVLALIGIAAIYRPLLYATVSSDAASARGVPVRALSYIFLVLMAVAVTAAAQIVGVLLTTALLIGPAGAAIHLSRRLPRVLALAAIIAVAETVAGIILAYASYYWPPGGKGWPTSFFIGVLSLGVYVITRAFAHQSRRE